MLSISKILDLPIECGDIRTVGGEFYQNIDGRFDDIISLWKSAGYTSDHIEWINFYPEIHFNSCVVDEFAAEVGVTPIRAWISCIRPGKSAPWHQDIDDNMDEYLKLGELVRYTCHINEPSHGQLLLIEDEAFYMIPKGTITKWRSYDAWHGSSNCGFKNHYLFHLLGYKNV